MKNRKKMSGKHVVKCIMENSSGGSGLTQNPDYWFTEEEKSTFAAIDRNKEDSNVDSFQKHGDIEVFNQIFADRVPSLQIWSKKYYYLSDSKEDLFSELSYCFLKAVRTYKKNRGPFNTWLYYLLQNCVRNLNVGRKAKKRLPAGMDPNSFKKFILSLDYSYDGKDGSKNTLGEVISEKASGQPEAPEKMNLDDTVNILANGDAMVAGFLKKLSDGTTVASLVKECKTRCGKLNLNKSQVKKLNIKKRQKKYVSAIIKANTDIQEDFFVVDYSVSLPRNLNYTIEMRKTKEADLVLKTIRRLRKEKKYVMSRIAV